MPFGKVFLFSFVIHGIVFSLKLIGIIALGLPVPVITEVLCLKTQAFISLFKAEKLSIREKVQLACQTLDFIFLSKKPHTDPLETSPRKIAHVY